MPTVGVLALQGAFARHQLILDRIGVDAPPVRKVEQLDGLDGLIIPGGESTAMSMLLERAGMFEPIAQLIEAGLAVFGTCAGMILLATDVMGGRTDQRSWGAIDISVSRNGYGRQVNSFDTWLELKGVADPFPASFVRAPVVDRTGADVEVLAAIGSQPVLCRSKSILVAAFHPELSDDTRIHEYFLEEVV